MKRRTFIWVSTAAAITLALPVASCSTTPSLEEILSSPKTLLAIKDMDTIRELGNSYMVSVPSETTRELLMHLLLRDTTGNAVFKPSEATALQQFIGKKIKNDFTMGELVFLKGWVLSKTEARQCALNALLKN